MFTNFATKCCEGQTIWLFLKPETAIRPSEQAIEQENILAGDSQK